MGHIADQTSTKAQFCAWPRRSSAILCLGIVLLLTGPLAAEDPYQVAWARQIGTLSGDFSLSVAVDGSSNAYIGGYTQGSLGGPNAGLIDAFLAKYSTSGNLVWSRQIGTSSEERGYAVAVDPSGHAYITGSTYGSLGGTNAGGADAFLTKYDGAGNVLWSRQAGTSDADAGYSVAADSSGNAYICGSTYGSLGGTNAGADDAFLIKYDASGNLLWSRQTGTLSGDLGYSVALDASGNAYISGQTSGSLGGTYAGLGDAFLVKYSASGSKLWSRQIGTSYGDGSRSVAVDASGNAYIAGWTGGSLDGSNAGGTDAFLTKYDASGNVLWSRQIGTSSNDGANSVAVDASGNVYISGSTRGNLGGTSAGDVDAFLAEYDASGNLLWATQIGTASEDASCAVGVDASGNAYISGYTKGSLDGISAGGYDAFLVKYEVPEPGTLSLLALGAIAILRRRRAVSAAR